MTWVIVFCALGAAALVAVAVCAWPVWREGMALFKQFGRSSEQFGEAMAPLSEALERLGEGQGSSPRR
jgi:hypothetical protein